MHNIFLPNFTSIPYNPLASNYAKPNDNLYQLWKHIK